MVFASVGDGEVGSVSMEVVSIGKFVPLCQCLVIELTVTIELSFILLTLLIWLHNNLSDLSLVKDVLLQVGRVLVG